MYMLNTSKWLVARAHYDPRSFKRSSTVIQTDQYTYQYIDQQRGEHSTRSRLSALLRARALGVPAAIEDSVSRM